MTLRPLLLLLAAVASLAATGAALAQSPLLGTHKGICRVVFARISAKCPGFTVSEEGGGGRLFVRVEPEPGVFYRISGPYIVLPNGWLRLDADRLDWRPPGGIQQTGRARGACTISRNERKGVGVGDMHCRIGTEFGRLNIDFRHARGKTSLE